MMHAALKLLLLALALCGSWLAAGSARAAPLGNVGVDFGHASISALSTPAKRPARRNSRTRRRTSTPAKPSPDAAAPPPDGIPELPARAGTPPAPPPPPNVKLRAALAAASPPLREGIGWRVLTEKPSGVVREDKIVWSGGGAEPAIRLNPGRYYVEASFGLARNGQEMEIPPEGTVESTVVLDAGTIRGRGVAVPGGLPLDDMFYVLRRADDAGQSGAEVGRSSLAQAMFHVRAGRYRLALQHGMARTEIPVTVAAGQEVQAEGVLNSGRIKLTAAANEGGPPLDDAVFFVYADDTGGTPKELARSELREATFDLPAGRYRVAAVYGLARTERQVTIKPGATAEEKLVLDAGGVRLLSVLAADGPVLDRLVIYKVYALSPDRNAPPQSVATSAKAAPLIHLKSGKYRIESQYGWHNARQTREIDVAAGQTTDLLFEHRASEVKLKLTAAPGTPALGRVKWIVKYANGGTVLISQDSAPSLILQAGSYQVVAQHGAKTYSRAFEANANEVHTIELVAD
jgi:hypothetical protein